MWILFVIIHTVKTEFNQFWMKSYEGVPALLIRLFFHILQNNLIVEAGRSWPSVVVGMNTNRKPEHSEIYDYIQDTRGSNTIPQVEVNCY